MVTYQTWERIVMEKTYNPQEYESTIYKLWEDNNCFAPRGTGDPFCIVIPPPNVTGALHVGHALNNTLQDVLIRYKRMKGFNALWIPGTDHAGIATQNVVEKQLLKEHTTRHDLGREKFVEKVWSWKAEYGNRITTQLRKLGCSVDWHHERFTMDDGCSKAVRKVFVSLYKEGLIYQGNYIINWCPRCHTALSDVEVEHEDLTGSFWHIKYPFADGNGYIEIATTRPETMFGDTAIAVNPKDERYRSILGKMVIIPFSGREVPIIADDHVDPEFGTGAVKVTPAHDPNDYEIGKRHNLEFIKVMDESAIMNENVPKQYQGLDRFVCRKQLVQDLEENGYLISVKEHFYSVGHCYRCHTIVEPYLSKQWFVAMKNLAAPAIDAVRSGKVALLPARWDKLYFDWMENIRDWCISRQIWWGHRIPVWYCEDCNKVICETEDPKECDCGSHNIHQDPDVLDTWFSSALWPFSTLGWPDQTSDLATFYPTSVLVTGYDIITFWVSRMIVMGLKFMNNIPFSKVIVHGLVRDAHGKKMSKSTGNAIDPLVVMDEYGTDALRFALAHLTTSGGQDIKLSTDKIASSRNFANKIWNVSRYVVMSLEEVPAGLDPATFDLADKWILSRYNRTVEKATELLENFEYGMACSTLYQFIWNDFCDWYIEFSKRRKNESMPIVLEVLKGSLSLLHPFMPFITEVIWKIINEKTGGTDKPLIIHQWPEANRQLINDEVENSAEIVFSVIHSIRNLRADSGIAPGIKLATFFSVEDENKQKLLEAQQLYISELAQLNYTDKSGEKQKLLYTSASGIDIYIKAQGVVNIENEKDRLQKKNKSIKQEIARLEGKLNNQSFVDKAPAEVVLVEQEKLATYKEQYMRLEKQLTILS